MFEAAVFCLAMNVYHEARGEPAQGRKLVAQTVMMRAGWDQRRVCNVVFAESQYSWTNGKVQKIRGGWGIDLSLKPREKNAWRAAQNLARTILMIGRPPAAELLGVTHYHTIAVRPAWAKKFTRIAVVGKHVFYR